MLDEADNDWYNEKDRAMKFNSQICTTKEQSERLLALGLKKETADCIWCEVRTLSKDNPIQWHLLPEYIDKYDEKHIPAWSLHRLLCLLPQEYIYDIDFQQIMRDFVFGPQDMYDEVISAIEMLSEEGYLYDEYLEK